MAIITYGWRVQGLDGGNYVSQQVADTRPRQPAARPTPPASPAASPLGAPGSVAPPPAPRAQVGASPAATAPRRVIPWSHLIVGLVGGAAGFYLGKRRSEEP